MGGGKAKFRNYSFKIWFLKAQKMAYFTQFREL
jgi:hypothetical protein